MTPVQRAWLRLARDSSLQALVFGAALLLLVWVFGPLLAIRGVHPLDTVLARLVATAAILGAGAVGLAWARWQARTGNEALIERLVDSAPVGKPAPAAPGAAPAAQADLAAVHTRFEAALATLRRRSFGAAGLPAAAAPGWRGAVARLRLRLQPRTLYELPWYVIIGAPGSGKTTALRHCGLGFALSDAAAAGGAGAPVAPVRGVGGTRDCDWWFTEQAVLIDTAGRFTTQDSEPATDAGTWAGFLALLKRSRTWQPLNGVLVTVSVSDLLARGDTERLQHAAAVRRRLQELHEQLRVRLPIYLLVTKCDLMAGFMESFEALGREQRANPWGFTFKLRSRAEPGSHVFDAYAEEFDTLQRRLAEGLIARLQAEPDAQRRARIYGFPAQFAALRGVLQAFVETVFAPSPFQGEPMLRGVYFVSGTQEGTPIDRMLGAIARSYQLEHAIAAPHEASGKSFFLTRLLNEVVFAEQGLAGTDAQWERRRNLLTLGSYAALAVLTVAALAVWGVSYSNNRQHVAAAAAAAEALQRSVRGLSEPTTDAADLRALLPALDQARALAEAEAGSATAGVPWSMGFGLYQGDKLGVAARTAYARLLADALLPRLVQSVADGLRAGSDRAATYEALKTYLMLHDPARLEPAVVQARFQRDWDERIAAGHVSAAQRERLGLHLQTLLAQGGVVAAQAADLALIAAVRARLAAVPLPQRVLDRLRRPDAAAAGPRDFTLPGLLGETAARLFVRASGRPLEQGVSGLFTPAGYRLAFERDLPAVVSALLAERAWVLGEAADAEPTPEPAALAEAVRALYLREYAASWSAFADDLRLAPATGLAAAEGQARLLAQAEGPLVTLLRSLEAQAAVLGQVEAGSVPAWRAALAGWPALQAHLAQAQRVLAAAGAGGGAGPAPPASLVAALKADAAAAPAPLRALLEGVAAHLARLPGLALREQLGHDVRAGIGEFCRAQLAGRYPLAPGAAREATLADFAALFGPRGRFAQLQPRLAPHVDTARWAFRAVPATGAATSLGSDAGSLAQFARAERIRAAFFDTSTLSVRLQFRAVALPVAVAPVSLEIDGQVLRSDAPVAGSLAVAWPGPGGSSRVRLAAPAGAEWSAEGPWALWRLIDRARVQAGPASGQWRLVFDLGGAGQAVFDVSAAAGQGALGLNALTDFNCPEGL